MEPITSIETIARQASDAAAAWVGGSPLPVNPYDRHLQPEHHAEWKRRFEIALVRLSAKDAA